MILKVHIADEARDFLRTVPKKHARQVIAKIELLAANPRPSQSKELEGYAPLRRLRSGDYRIVYFVEDDVLKVPIVDKRGDDQVYRNLSRKFR